MRHVCGLIRLCALALSLVLALGLGVGVEPPFLWCFLGHLYEVALSVLFDRSVDPSSEPSIHDRVRLSLPAEATLAQALILARHTHPPPPRDAAQFSEVQAEQPP